MNAKEVNMILMSKDKKEKERILDELFSIFESYNSNIEDSVEITQVLINYSVEETELNLVDRTQDALDMAFCNPTMTADRVAQLDFGRIASNLSFSANNSILARFIDILSFSHDKKYANCILQYMDNEDQSIRQSVDTAVLEMQLRTSTTNE